MFMQGLSVEFIPGKLFFVLVDIKGRYTRTLSQKISQKASFGQAYACIRLQYKALHGRFLTSLF